MHLILLSNDLMITSLVSGAASQHDLTVKTVSNPVAAVEALGDEARVLVVDLRFPGLNVTTLMESIRTGCSHDVRVVAFGPHVHEDNLAAAREAGCDAVVTRGQFDREAAQIIGRLL